MVAKRRQRKPLRSELSDGIRKTRKVSGIVTVVPEISIRVKDDREVTLEILPENTIEISENKKEDILEEITESYEEELEEVESEEQAIRKAAQELGISHWWKKKIENLKLEIEKLENGEQQ